MASNSVNIHRLQQAINSRGMKILYNTSQFYSDKQDRPVTMYCVKQAIFDENKGKHTTVELYKSTSQLQILLFLRDFWFELNGWELPTDNEMWNEAKRKQQEKERSKHYDDAEEKR